MDFLIENPKDLSKSQILIGLISTLDLFVSLCYFFCYYYWENVTSLYLYLSCAQIFHMISWLCGITIAIGIKSNILGMITIQLYAFSFIADLVTFLVRISFYYTGEYSSRGENSMYTFTQWIFVLILASLSGINFLVSIIVVSKIQAFVFRVQSFIERVCGSNSKVFSFYKTSPAVYAYRLLLRYIWQFDILITFVVTAFVISGVGLSKVYNEMILMFIPHFFIWICSIVISGFSTSISVPSDASWNIDYIFVTQLIHCILLIPEGYGFSMMIYEINNFCHHNCGGFIYYVNLIISILCLLLFICTVIKCILFKLIEIDLRKNIAGKRVILNRLIELNKNDENSVNRIFSNIVIKDNNLMENNGFKSLIQNHIQRWASKQNNFTKRFFEPKKIK